MQQQNKAFITRYFNALAGGVPKTKELLEQYITDEELLRHIYSFEPVFPGYEVVSEGMTAEGNMVVVKALFRGVHKGDFNGIAPTHKNVEVPFAIGYEIENEKIVSHWIIIDRLSLMEQLGVMNAPTEVA